MSLLNNKKKNLKERILFMSLSKESLQIMTIQNVINTIFRMVCVHSIEHNINMCLNLADSNICNCTCVEVLTTYILLQSSAPDSYKGCNEASGINTHIGDSANTNTQQNNCNAQFRVSRVSNFVQHNFQKAGYRDHTQLSNL